ncbi:MAG: hypothetical protein Q7T59_00595 [Candidatus Woesebacteria bacterium]|nr:hypothetical protein [Candidatus Woesebacteria bacterium]
MQEVLEPQPKPQVAPSVVRKFSNPTSGKKNLILGVVSVLVVLAGIGTGYYFSGVKDGGKLIKSGDSIKVTQNEAGITDESKFSTTTDGVLTEGGIGGEGTYHLVRGSGPSQYAYLTSSVIDMGPFVGKKVQIWGETVSGKKAGWLIDVGKIKVVD